MAEYDTRWLGIEATARYLNVRPDALGRLVRKKRIPAPSYALGRRSPRWDRRRLDAAFASGEFSIDVDAVVDEIVQDLRNGS